MVFGTENTMTKMRRTLYVASGWSSSTDEDLYRLNRRNNEHFIRQKQTENIRYVMYTDKKIKHINIKTLLLCTYS